MTNSLRHFVFRFLLVLYFSSQVGHAVHHITDDIVLEQTSDSEHGCDLCQLAMEVFHFETSGWFDPNTYKTLSVAVFREPISYIFDVFTQSNGRDPLASTLLVLN